VLGVVRTGEFLELCAKAGIMTRGIDLDAGMVAHCRAAGLAASRPTLASRRAARRCALGGTCAR
jgi:hypothetical protein